VRIFQFFGHTVEDSLSATNKYPNRWIVSRSWNFDHKVVVFGNGSFGQGHLYPFNAATNASMSFFSVAQLHTNLADSILSPGPSSDWSNGHM
jgi:hypothetical protein